MLGEYLARHERLEEALESYSRAIDLEPGHHLALLASGLTSKKLGRHEAAEAMLTAVLAAAPWLDLARIERGASRLAQGKARLAELDLAGSAAAAPLDWRRHLEQAALLKQKGDLHGAIAMLGKAVDINPCAFPAHVLRGRLLIEAAQFEQAEAEFSRAIDGLNRSATTGDSTGRPQDESGPDRRADHLLGAYQERARARARLGRIDAAREDMRDASILAWDSGADACARQAWFLATCPDHRLRDPAEAVALAEDGVGQTPENAGAWNTLGLARCRARDWLGAVEALARATRLRFGGDACDYVLLAMSYRRLGDASQARRWYGKAVEKLAGRAPPDEDLRQLHHEARQLLGLSAEPQPASLLQGIGAGVAFQCMWCGADWPGPQPACLRCGSPHLRTFRPPARGGGGKRALAAVSATVVLLMLSCTTVIGAAMLWGDSDRDGGGRPGSAASKGPSPWWFTPDNANRDGTGGWGGWGGKAASASAADEGGKQSSQSTSQDGGETHSVPEPATVVLLSLGLAGLAGYRWLRRRGRPRSADHQTTMRDEAP